MRITLALAAGFVGLGACYQEYQPATTPAPHFGAQPLVVQGPPGGEIDPGYAYTGPSGEISAGYEAGVDAQGVAAGGAIEVTGTVTDAEIDATLDGYGRWVEDEEFGRIWRPDATVVGVDFTPYETCGTWLYTDHGWTYSCDWSWGWLPFHYGNWGWFDDYWAWVPDYTWSPGWVEWRSGGGYVGWRPIGPRVRDHRRGSGGVRDHRDGVADRGPIVRDHRRRRTGEADWRFVADRDLAAGRRIRPALVHNAVGLSTTSIVATPPIRATAPSASSRVTDIMRNRAFARADRFNSSPGYTRDPSSAKSWTQPGAVRRPPSQANPAWTAPSRGYDRSRANPSWTSPSRDYDRRPPYTPSSPSQSWTPPSRGYDRSPPTGTFTPSRGYDRSPPTGTFTPTTPSRGYDRRPPSQTYTPSTPSRSWQPPSRTYTPMTPSAPSRPYTPPSRTYTPMTPSSPSRPYAPPSSSSSRSWSSPSSGRSRSYSPSSSSSGSSHRASPSSSSSGGSHRASPSSSSSGGSHRASPSGGGRRR